MKLEELRALCDAATPEPWRYGSTNDNPRTRYVGTACDRRDVPGYNFEVRQCPGQEDAAFISAARAALPLLLAVAEAAQEAVANDDEWGKFTLGDRYIPPSDKIYTEKMRAALAALEAAP